MLNIYADSTIYVLCPAKIVTGGIEAVHQLVHKLNTFGHHALIVPVPVVSNPALLQYRNYDVAFSSDVVDNERNLLITTEVNPKALGYYRFIQKAIWWLSVDFHEALKEKFDFEDSQSSRVMHFAQSAYAASFLQSKGVTNFYYLTDYLHAAYFTKSKHQQKDNVVLYTPVKGAQAYIQRLMKADASIQWLAMTGMIRKQHARTMQQGKVYVDLGNHPGKDRQPREAVVNGCCVIVGLAGAARFEEDIPIPQEYKFDLQTMNEDKILDAIRSCLAAYEKRCNDFSHYAATVRCDEQRFEEEVKAIFGVKSLRKKVRGRIVLVNILIFAQQNDWLTLLRGLVNELLPLWISGSSKSLYRSVGAKMSKGLD
jgi:hypothetical protein